MAEEKKPRVNSEGAKELEKAKDQIDQFEASVKEMTLDRMNMAPKQETEPKTQISQKELNRIPDHYLKPSKVVGSKQTFNERFRDEYNYMKQYVCFIAEHNENSDLIEQWTRPYGGMNAEFWEVPTNKPVWGPRYLAEDIKKRCYHRLIMKPNVQRESTGTGTFYGQMAADITIQRLDARPVNPGRKSVFMGADGT